MSGLRKLIVAMSSLAPTLVWGDKSSVKLENSVDDLVVQAEIPKSGKFMGYGFDALWMMNGPHLVRIAVAYGSVWVTGDTKSELYRIDPKSNLIVATIPMSSQPRFLAAGEGSVWVFNQGDGIVQRVDPGTNEVTAAIDTGRPGGGGNIVVGGGYVWLSMLHGTPVVQIDANTNKLIRNFRGYGIDAGWGDAIQFGADSVWVSGSSVHRIEVPN